MASVRDETRIAMRPRHYNTNCSHQEAAMRAALDLLPIYNHAKHLTVIDYGCSQGANSIEPLKKVVSSLPDGAIATLLFEDTPFNDFSTLAGTIHNTLLPALPPTIDIFPSLVPVSFFRPVTAPATADLGLSWSSFSYLSSQPAVNLDATASPADFAAARHAALASVAHGDLITILRLRAQEIKPGGYLVAAIGGNRSATAGPDVAKSNPGGGALQAGMMVLVGAGKASVEELMACALWPSHERTPEEVRAALEADEVAPLWEAETVEAKLIAHPAWEEYQGSAKDKGSYTRYARAVIEGLVAAAGAFWVQTLKRFRGEAWDGGDEWLEELIDAAVREFVDKFPEMKIEIWYNYLRLKRKAT